MPDSRTGSGSRVYRSLNEPDLKGVMVCIGNFDGVHRGHRGLLGRMRELAMRHDAPSLVVTFFPPAKVVFGNATYLSSEQEKLDLIGGFEPTGVVMIPFSNEYASTDKVVFVDQLRRLAPHTIVVGEDFRFGHGRAGNLNDLSPIASRLEVFGLITHEGEVVKSSRVREHLARGDVERANALLGAPYRATGEVVHGEKRGRTIGYPTANVATGARKALPPGVYAVTVAAPQGEFGGMAAVGTKPMFPDEPPTLEVNLFDFDDDLYGEDITVFFHAFVREQARFGSMEELKSALARDEERSRAALTDMGRWPAAAG